MDEIKTFIYTDDNNIKNIKDEINMLKFQISELTKFYNSLCNNCEIDYKERKRNQWKNAIRRR